MTSSTELQRVQVGPEPGEVPGGIGTVDVVAVCLDNASIVLGRTREVLEILLPLPDEDALPLPVWQHVLPAWFVAASAPERTSQEAEADIERWRSLSLVEQAEVARTRRWTLSGWLYWFESGEREWRWWDATIEAPNRLRISVEIPGWPTAFGALSWLLRAAGAVEVLIDEEADD